jgi:RNA polymerase sigma-70 factor (ECF subfamily)
VQETRIAAAKRTPERRESLRPWLAKVLRDAFRMRARSEGRRAAREQAATLVSDEVPTPESLVARAEAQRGLVDLVLRLDEPYRSTVLLHYSEGVSLADIARAQGIPAGTVRWRMKAAIDQLRTWLDERDDGKQWAVTLLALPKGLVVAHKTSKVAFVILLLLLLLGGGGYFLFVRGDGAGKSGGAGGTSGTAASSGGSSAGSRGVSAGGGDDAAVPAWLVQHDVKPRRIAGRVVTLEGRPVGGAIVELGSLMTRGGHGVPPRLTTNDRGEFDFGARPATAYAVSASASGRAGAVHSVDLRDPPPRHHPTSSSCGWRRATTPCSAPCATRRAAPSRAHASPG